MLHYTYRGAINNSSLSYFLWSTKGTSSYLTLLTLRRTARRLVRKKDLGMCSDIVRAEPFLQLT